MHPPVAAHPDVRHYSGTLSVTFPLMRQSGFSSAFCFFVEKLGRPGALFSFILVLLLLSDRFFFPVIFQTAYIPDELYKQVYDVCKRLLTYPQPYCSVGLGCSRQIKMERSTPGMPPPHPSALPQPAGPIQRTMANLKPGHTLPPLT